MAYPSLTELHKAERVLRADDKNLRLRFSQESSDVLVERRTFRGRIGRTLPGGDVYPPDGGRRREEGHVLIATVPSALFDVTQVRDELRAADSWRKWDRNADPLWRRAEQDDARRAAEKAAKKGMDSRAHASSLFDRYSWATKSRVAVSANVG